MGWPQTHRTQKIKFPYKGILQHFTNTSQPSCLGVNYSWADQCRACGKTASLKHILTGCKYVLRSYTWRHNEVLEIFAKAAKICCETANKALNNIANKAIHFFKEDNILKLSHKNKHRLLMAVQTGTSQLI